MYIDKFTYHVDNDVDYFTYVDNFTFLWNQNQNIYSTKYYICNFNKAIYKTYK